MSFCRYTGYEGERRKSQPNPEPEIRPMPATDTATGTITIYQREIELGARGAYGSILSLEPMPSARGTGLYLGDSFPVATVAVPAGCVVSGGLVRIDRDHVA